MAPSSWRQATRRGKRRKRRPSPPPRSTGCSLRKIQPLSPLIWNPPPYRPSSTVFPSLLLLMCISSWSSAAPRQSTRPWQLWGGSGHGYSGAILVISVLSSMLYARLITRPIVRISGISQKCPTWTSSCGAEERTDEIGTLAHSLNTLADRLSATMQALREANASLQADIHRERELEQARLNFFLRRLPRAQNSHHHRQGAAERHAGWHWGLYRPG